MTNPTYTPVLTGPDLTDPTQHTDLAHKIETKEITHVRDTKGEVWRTHTWLNKKSVPLNHAGIGPTRLAFDKVESFGVLEQVEEKPAEEAEAEEPPKPAAAAPAHQERAHALLSASSAYRWLNCTPSAVLDAQHPDTESDAAAAAEGTAAHELAEHKLRTMLGYPSEHPTSEWQNEDMEAHTDDYADHVMAELARTREASPAAFVAIEQRLDFSHVVPDGFGTGDAIIVGDGTLTVVDLKYGKGVEVSAAGNPQMRLYALGALKRWGMIYNVRQVRMVIFQPRLGNISVDEITVDELNTWADEIVQPKAELAQNGDGDLQAGDWCRFCRHAPQCTALAAQHFQIIPTETDEVAAAPTAPAPDTLTDDQVARIVEHAGEIKKWLTKVETYAIDQANTGKAWPGLKLVEGRAVRKWTDEEAVATAVKDAGHDPYKPREVLGITAMTKALGKPAFDQLLGDLVHKPDGKPTLVPETDKRPAITVATPDTVFTQIGYLELAYQTNP